MRILNKRLDLFGVRISFTLNTRKNRYQYKYKILQIYSINLLLIIEAATMVTTRRQAKQNCIQTRSKATKNQPAKTTHKTKKPKKNNKRLIENSCCHPIDLVDSKDLDRTCYQPDERSEDVRNICWQLPMYRYPEVLQNMMVAACPTFTLELLSKLNLRIDNKTICWIVRLSIEAFMADVLPLTGYYDRSFIRLKGWKQGECSLWLGRRWRAERTKSTLE